MISRLAFLGQRVAHFDEGRVGYWTLEFMRTGSFHYHYITHGPLIQHLNTYVFATFGVNDFTARLFVALVGAALPATALLYRRHLRDDELVALALFLAVNPVLLYYSRFLRSTVLVAGFMFAAFGCLVRAYDTRKPLYVHGAVVLVALAFSAKENAAVYLLTWVGATVLLLDHSLFRPGTEETGLTRIRIWWRNSVQRWPIYRETVPRYVAHGGVSLVLFLGIIMFFYAPRTAEPTGVGLWQALGNPGSLPTLLEATVADIVDGYSYWFGGVSRGENLVDTFLGFLWQFIVVLITYAGPLFVLAAGGFLLERYGTRSPRYLVLFASYWGFVSIVGYPLGTDIFGAWLTVNAIVPLAIPAAVGLAWLYRQGRTSIGGNDRFGPMLIAVLLLLMAGQVAVTTANGVYRHPTADHNELVQYAQPADDFRPALQLLDNNSVGSQGPDVVFYGEELVVENPPKEGIRPYCADISPTLPLQWYLKRANATATCAANESELVRLLSSTDPPIVIARSKHRETLEARLDGYTVHTARLRTSNAEIVLLVDADRFGVRRNNETI